MGPPRGSSMLAQEPGISQPVAIERDCVARLCFRTMTASDRSKGPCANARWGDVRDLLRARGLRWTPQRRTLIEVPSQTDGHVTGAELVERCRAVDPETIRRRSITERSTCSRSSGCYDTATARTAARSSHVCRRRCTVTSTATVARRPGRSTPTRRRRSSNRSRAGGTSRSTCPPLDRWAVPRLPRVARGLTGALGTPGNDGRHPRHPSASRTRRHQQRPRSWPTQLGREAHIHQGTRLDASRRVPDRNRSGTTRARPRRGRPRATPGDRRRDHARGHDERVARARDGRSAGLLPPAGRRPAGSAPGTQRSSSANGRAGRSYHALGAATGSRTSRGRTASPKPGYEMIRRSPGVLREPRRPVRGSATSTLRPSPAGSTAAGSRRGSSARSRASLARSGGSDQSPIRRRRC